MTIHSYAQNFEDVLLWRALGSVPGGTYVDVGAGHPVHNSVTKLFSDAGWSGLNVEPLPQLAAALEADRPRDVTVHGAVTAAEVSEVKLTVVEDWDELSTISAARSEELTAGGRRVAQVAVPAVRLDDALKAAGIEEIHFLKIDVEGAELDVLQTIDLTVWRPWVIVVEVVSGTSERDDRSAISAAVVDAGYVEAYFDGLNLFFVAHERAADLVQHFAVPVNVTDDFVVSGSDRVVVDKIGETLGLATPAAVHEVLERVSSVLRDRIEFENRLSQTSVRTERELRAATLTIESLNQTAFARERLIAWYAAEVHNLDASATRATRALEEAEAREAAHLAELETLRRSRQEMLASTSWRITLPLRVLRRPKVYLRALTGRP